MLEEVQDKQTISIRKNQLPDIIQWKVGKTYSATLDLKMVEFSIVDEPIARFEIVSVKPTKKKEEAYEDKGKSEFQKIAKTSMEGDERPTPSLKGESKVTPSPS